jgi:hypothetical protein
MAFAKRISASVCVLALLATGCSTDTAEVSGRVTFRQPLKRPETISLTFMGPSGQTFTAPVAEDGSYRAEGLDVGETKVSVLCIPAEFLAAAAEHREIQKLGVAKLAAGKGGRRIASAPPQLASFPNPVPKQYWSTGKSPLGLTTVAGSNAFDIQIEN